MASETSPLLVRSGGSADISEGTGNSTSQSWASIALNNCKRYRILYLCALFLFVFDFPSFMRIAPMMRTLELGVCRDYYQRHEPIFPPIDGSLTSDLCGIDAVQKQTLVWQVKTDNLYPYKSGLTRRTNRQWNKTHEYDLTYQIVRGKNPRPPLTTSPPRRNCLMDYLQIGDAMHRGVSVHDAVAGAVVCVVESAGCKGNTRTFAMLRKKVLGS
jgi:hypothetical protein